MSLLEAGEEAGHGDRPGADVECLRARVARSRSSPPPSARAARVGTAKKQSRTSERSSGSWTSRKPPPAGPVSGPSATNGGERRREAARRPRCRRRRARRAPASAVSGWPAAIAPRATPSPACVRAAIGRAYSVERGGPAAARAQSWRQEARELGAVLRLGRWAALERRGVPPAGGCRRGRSRRPSPTPGR